MRQMRRYATDAPLRVTEWNSCQIFGTLVTGQGILQTAALHTFIHLPFIRGARRGFDTPVPPAAFFFGLASSSLS